jgi:diguanylate cyclase (GGDEF)-like protein
MNMQPVDDILRRTLADFRLSRGERGVLVRIVDQFADSEQQLGLIRSRAFAIAAEKLVDPTACDVDHFKHVNVTYGHPVGDEVLRQVARVLQQAVRKIDIPARYGGEEFAVVLEATGSEGALNLAERIRRDVAALALDSDKGQFHITMSIGIATFPDDAHERALLIERADASLYFAKENGRNRCVTFPMMAASRRLRKAS